jgi:hypothetical protein
MGIRHGLVAQRFPGEQHETRLEVITKKLSLSAQSQATSTDRNDIRSLLADEARGATWRRSTITGAHKYMICSIEQLQRTLVSTVVTGTNPRWGLLLFLCVPHMLVVERTGTDSYHARSPGVTRAQARLPPVFTHR